MIKNAKKITSITRRHEFFVMRQRIRFQLFCEQCADEQEFVSLDDAVLFSGLAAREVVRLTETGGLHFLETSGGHLFVCRTSLNEKIDG
ncbi:MAG: hypothetical protein M3Q99_17320 [Acidobacteriota bacterium]|nr:hypothetical protein [Acidobacteriota bacterium]